MYESFKIKNFKCFKDISILGLKRINLIAGKNNVGKTALLEALFIHCGTYKPELVLRISGFRGISIFTVELTKWAESPWDSVFNNFDTSQIIELIAKKHRREVQTVKIKVVGNENVLTSGRHFFQDHSAMNEDIPLATESAKVLQLEFVANKSKKSEKHFLTIGPKGVQFDPTPPPPFTSYFIASRAYRPLEDDADQFGKIEMRREKSTVIDVLKVIEKRLRDLTIITTKGRPMIYGDVGLSRYIPLPEMGEGISRLCSLVLSIGNAPNGVVLIDEIENGIHHSKLSDVWRVIAEAARRFNTQIFATTHSYECLSAAHEAFKNNGEYDFRLLRLEELNGAIKAVTYDEESLEAAIESEMEVR